MDTPPTRRSLLRTVGLAGVLGLAGCTTTGETPGGEPTATPTPTPHLDAPEGAVGHVSLTATDDAPDLPVEPSVSLEDPFVTDESPPVLRVDVENQTDESVTIGEYREVVFQYAASNDPGYVLLPHSERSTEGVPARSIPDVPTADGEACWQLTESIAITMEYGTVSIPADGRLTAFVGLYADHEADSCLPTGEHRFDTAYAIDPLAEVESETETETATTEPPSATWGFSLAVESL